MKPPAFFDIQQHFYFKTEGAITASMLAESLLGLDGVAKRAAEFLASYLEVEIKDAEVLISSFKIGSMEEEWWFRLAFGKGKAGQERFEKFRNALGLKNMEPTKLVGLAMAVAIGFGIHWYASSGGDEKVTIQIENSFNNWGRELALSKEELLALLDNSLTHKDELKKSIVRLTHPDGHPQGGEIVLNNDPVTTLSEEMVAVVPQVHKKDEAEEPSKDFDNAEIVIRAMDLDKPDSGWWAIAPTIDDRRLQLQLGGETDPMTIPYGKIVKADITVYYRVDAHGNKTPKKLQLRKLRE